MSTLRLPLEYPCSSTQTSMLRHSLLSDASPASSVTASSPFTWPSNPCCACQPHHTALLALHPSALNSSAAAAPFLTWP